MNNCYNWRNRWGKGVCIFRNVSNGIAREDIRRIPKRVIREVDNI